MKPLLCLIALFALFFAAIYLQAQTPNPNTGTLQGKVTDDAGLGIPGAHIEIVGTKRGTMTKLDGTFILAGLHSGTYTVNIFSLGKFAPNKEVEIVGGTVTAIDVALQDDPRDIDSLIILIDRRIQVEPGLSVNIVDSTRTHLIGQASVPQQPVLPAEQTTQVDASGMTKTSRIIQSIARDASVNTTGGGIGIRGCCHCPINQPAEIRTTPSATLE